MNYETSLEATGIITNAYVLSNRLCYPRNLELAWLTKDKIIQYAKDKGWRYKKIAERLEDKIARHKKRYKKRIHKSYEPIHQWWAHVHEIPEKDVCIFMPLISIPINYDEKKYSDWPPKFHKDILDITKKSTKELKNLVSKLRISRKSYLVFLDELFFPCPIEPDKYSLTPERLDENIYSIPLEVLRDNFTQHVTTSPLIRNLQGSMAMMKNTIDNLRRENRPVEGYLKELEEDEESFRKNLKLDIDIVRIFCDLQLQHFVEHQLEEKYVYVLGKKGDVLDIYGSIFDTARAKCVEFISPYESVTDTDLRQKISKQGDHISKRALRHLEHRIRKTYLRDKPLGILGGFL